MTTPESSSSTTSTSTSLSQEPSDLSGVRRHPLAKCEECTLNVKGNAFVPTKFGDPKIIVIGEAPGFMEAKEGKPFTGPSGKLLGVVLDQVGYNKDELTLTNACLCRPPDNRTPTTQEVKACWPRLKAEIDELQPDTIVALGNTASQVILGTTNGITVTRVGPPKKSPYFDAGVIATFHPAACLRTSDYFPHLCNDLGKLNKTLQVQWEEPKYEVYDDVNAVQVLQTIHREYREIVVDIEVGIEKDTDFDHPERYQFLCVGLGFKQGHAVVIGENALKHPDVQYELKSLLEDPEVRWIAHNGKFDLAGLTQFGRASLWFDTMLASYALDERGGVHGLKYIATELLGAPDYASDIKRYVGKGDSYAVVPRDILYRYNAYDITCTFMLFRRYSIEMDADARRVHDFLVQCSNALIPMEMAGVAVDVEYLDILTEDYLKDLEVLEQQLKPWVANPRSPLQVKVALHEMGFKVIGTDVDILKACLDKCSPEGKEFEFIDTMLKHRKEQKLYGTYVKGTRKRLYKGRVHPTFMLHGTTSGRHACRNPNLHNVPRDSKIRRLFGPEGTNVWVQADYAAIELRVIACLTHDPWLREVLSDRERDIHNEVALSFFGPGFTKDQRVRAKAVVYGLGYGREAFSIAQEFKISVREAEKYMEIFFGRIPEVVKWQITLADQIKHGSEDLITHFGRHRRFWLVTRDNMRDLVKEGLSFLPQSTASDICQHAMLELRNVHHLNVKFTVHDNIIVECTPEEAVDVAALMTEVMPRVAAEVYSDFVPFPVETSIGKNWGEL